MSSTTLRAIFTGTIAVAAVGGGVTFALVAQAHGLSPEPPAWLSLLIGGAVTYYYGQTASLNGSTSALNHFAAAVTARRAADPVAVAASEFVPPVQLIPGSAIGGTSGPPPASPSSGA